MCSLSVPSRGANDMANKRRRKLKGRRTGGQTGRGSLLGNRVSKTPKNDFTRGKKGSKLEWSRFPNKHHNDYPRLLIRVMKGKVTQVALLFSLNRVIYEQIVHVLSFLVD